MAQQGRVDLKKVGDMKLKKYNVIPAVLFLYLCVMVYLGYPGYVSGATSPWLYFGGTAFTIGVIILLRFNLKKRIQYRHEREADIQKAKLTKDSDKGGTEKESEINVELNLLRFNLKKRIQYRSESETDIQKAKLTKDSDKK